MPRRIYRRKRPVRRTRRTTRGKSTGNMVLYKSMSQMPFPRVFQTKFKCVLQGYIKQGQALSSAGISVNLNSPYLPFSASGLGTGAVFGGVAPAYNTIQPGGYSSLMNTNLYNNYRVIGSKIMIRVCPQSLSDNGAICTITPTFITSPATAAIALEQPYTKKMLVTEAKQNIVSNYMTQHRLLGISKRAIEYDLSGKYFGFYNALPGAAMYWQILFSNNDGSTLSSNLPFEIEVTYYTKCWTVNTGNILEV